MSPAEPSTVDSVSPVENPPVEKPRVEKAPDEKPPEKKERQDAGRILQRVTGKVDYSFAVSADRRLVASSLYKKKTLVIHDLETGQLHREMPLPSPEQMKTLLGIERPSGQLNYATTFPPSDRSIAFTPDGASVVAAIMEDLYDCLAVWDLETAKVQLVIPEMELDGVRRDHDLVAATDKYFVSCERFVRDPETPVAQVFSRNDGSRVATYTAHKKVINFLTVSRDGKHALTGGDERIAVLWELATGKELQLLDAHEYPVECGAISPDGRFALTGGFDCTLLLWDLASGRVLHSWNLGGFSQPAFMAADMARRQWILRQRLRDINDPLFLQSPPTWEYPYVNSVDFDPTGTRALVGFYVSSPDRLKHKSNPLLLDLQSKKPIPLPGVFAARSTLGQMSVGHPRFTSGGRAALFRRPVFKRVRGETVLVPELLILSLP
jgi:WD40 repeat protein